MRTNLVICGILVMLSGGCQTFSGQWLEVEGAGPTSGLRTKDYVRMALDFDPVSAVRIGIYNETAGVVDTQSVQADTYVVYDNGHVAQFGAAMARLDGDSLHANVAGASREFHRVHGKSIFPPLVKIPALTRGVDPFAERYVSVSP